MAPSQIYKGLQKTKKRKQRDTASLPRHILDHKFAVQFGQGTLPSDNMNMVMTHEFQQNFNQKMNDKKMINAELEKIAKMTQKNQKFNIPLTTAQAIRMNYTKNQLQRHEDEHAENLYYQEHHVPKMYSSPGQRSMSSKSPRTKMLKMQASKGELPPLQLKRKNNDQEKEIIGLIKKNLLIDKTKLKSQLAQSLSTHK